MRRRAVSEVVSALIIAAVIIAGTAVYLAVAGQNISISAKSVAGALRDALHRQGEVLSLTYSYLDGSQLKLYVYNYGKVFVKPERVYVNGAQRSFTLTDAISGSSISEIAPRQLALLTVQKHGNSPYEIIIVTEKHAVFTWKVVA